jgi:hypothetical protein
MLSEFLDCIQFNFNCYTICNKKGPDKGLLINKKNILYALHKHVVHTVLIRDMHVHKPYIICQIHTGTPYACVHTHICHTHVCHSCLKHALQKHTVCAENVHTIWGTAVGKMLPFFNTFNKEVVNWPIKWPVEEKFKIWIWLDSNISYYQKNKIKI